MAGLVFEPDLLDIPAEMNEFNLEGRYPLSFLEPPASAEAFGYMERAKRVFEWLTRQL